ncbi:hypothetical protein VNO77_37569 [Canavalia gladiata]|uniref:Uncharacterized protein n=1 Tax=Canavalia gladiata TaxID=3824 RepID=A0AAN9KAF0_CANGL
MHPRGVLNVFSELSLTGLLGQLETSNHFSTKTCSLPRAPSTTQSFSYAPKELNGITKDATQQGERDLSSVQIGKIVTHSGERVPDF